MNEPQAIEKAMESRASLGVPLAFKPMASEKRIIELVRDGQKVATRAPSPGPVRDLVAWVVTLVHEARTVEIAIDDQTGEVVRYSPSRGAALDLHGGSSPDLNSVEAT